MMIIYVRTYKQMVLICAELVRQGIQFSCRRDEDMEWEVRLTGGF